MSRLPGLCRISIVELRARFGRTLLTGLSLYLGILSIVAISMISAVAEQTYVRNAEMVQGRQGTAVTTLDATAANLALASRVIDSLPGALLMVDSTGAQVHGSTGPINVTGYYGKLLNIFPWRAHHDELRGQTLMNAVASQQVGPVRSFKYLDATTPLPRAVTIDQVIEDGSPSSVVLVPQDYLGTLGPDATVTLYFLEPSGDATLARDRLFDAMQRIGFVGIDDISSVDVLTALRIQTRVLRLGFYAAGGVTLVVGIISVLNIGLATLDTRVEELALRRSLGASRNEIKVLVLLDGMAVGVCGALMAVFTTLLAFRPVVTALIPTNTPTYPWEAAAVGVVAGVLAGLVGGLVPALRAGRIPIATVMRG